MFLYSLSLNTDDLSVARKHLASKLPQVKRSHLAEALATSLGFNTSIALQTAIRFNPGNERRYQRFDGQAFFSRLDALGYTLEQKERAPFMDILFPKSVSLNFVLTDIGAVHSTLSELGKRLEELAAPSRAMVDACKRVLSEAAAFRKTPAVFTSYQAKHCIEKGLDMYITNGALIQAVVELGMPFKGMEGPNVLLYMSEKALQEAVRVVAANDVGRKDVCNAVVLSAPAP